MALFRRLFYRKPPDHLLEISERVYVFDCCFSTDILEGDEYKAYMNGIVVQLQEHFPESSFMVFNFREGDKESELFDLLTPYDITVMDCPRQYEKCLLLPLEMINQFLQSCDNWLSLEGQQNVLLLHCERGGWPVLAFMLAGLLLYRKQFTGEQKTLEMMYKQASKELLHFLSPINPQPSQLRYLHYISRKALDDNWPPPGTLVEIDTIILRFLPVFEEGKGCRPVVRVYGKDPSVPVIENSKLLFSTATNKVHPRHYVQADCNLVKIDIHCHVKGDVVIECVHLEDDKVHEEMMFKAMFHTSFLRSNLLVLGRDEIDVLWDAKDQFPKDFKAEVLFLDADSFDPAQSTTEDSSKSGSASPEEFFEVEEIFSNLVDVQETKGGRSLEADGSEKEVWKEDAEPHAFQDCSSEDVNQRQDGKVHQFSPHAVKDIGIDVTRETQDGKIDQVKDIVVDQWNNKADPSSASAEMLRNKKSKEVFEEEEEEEEESGGTRDTLRIDFGDTAEKKLDLKLLEQKKAEKIILPPALKKPPTFYTKAVVDTAAGKQNMKRQEPSVSTAKSPSKAKPTVSRWIPSNKGSYTNSMHVAYPPIRTISAPPSLATPTVPKKTNFLRKGDGSRRSVSHTDLPSIRVTHGSLDSPKSKFTRTPPSPLPQDGPSCLSLKPAPSLPVSPASDFRFGATTPCIEDIPDCSSSPHPPSRLGNLNSTQSLQSLEIAPSPPPPGSATQKLLNVSPPDSPSPPSPSISNQENDGKNACSPSAPPWKSGYSSIGTSDDPFIPPSLPTRTTTAPESNTYGVFKDFPTPPMHGVAWPNSPTTMAACLPLHEVSPPTLTEKEASVFPKCGPPPPPPPPSTSTSHVHGVQLSQPDEGIRSMRLSRTDGAQLPPPPPLMNSPPLPTTNEELPQPPPPPSVMGASHPLRPIDGVSPPQLPMSAVSPPLLTLMNVLPSSSPSPISTVVPPAPPPLPISALLPPSRLTMGVVPSPPSSSPLMSVVSLPPPPPMNAAPPPPSPPMSSVSPPPPRPMITTPPNSSPLMRAVPPPPPPPPPMSSVLALPPLPMSAPPLPPTPLMKEVPPPPPPPISSVSPSPPLPMSVAPPLPSPRMSAVTPLASPLMSSAPPPPPPPMSVAPSPPSLMSTVPSPPPPLMSTVPPPPPPPMRAVMLPPPQLMSAAPPPPPPPMNVAPPPMSSVSPPPPPPPPMITTPPNSSPPMRAIMLPPPQLMSAAPLPPPPPMNAAPPPPPPPMSSVSPPPPPPMITTPPNSSPLMRAVPPPPPHPPPMSSVPPLPPPPMSAPPPPPPPLMTEVPPPPPPPISSVSPSPPLPMSAVPPPPSPPMSAVAPLASPPMSSVPPPPPPPMSVAPPPPPPLMRAVSPPPPPLMSTVSPPPPPPIRAVISLPPPLMSAVSPPPPPLMSTVPPPPPPPIRAVISLPPHLMSAVPPPPPPPMRAGSSPPPPSMSSAPSVTPPLMSAAPLPPPPPMIGVPPPPPPPLMSGGPPPPPSMIGARPPPPPPMIGGPPPPAGKGMPPPPPPLRGGAPPPPSGFGPPGPPAPRPPGGVAPPPPMGAKGPGLGGSSLVRGGVLSRATAVKKSSLKPLHWSKVTRALKGSLWEELQRSGETHMAPEFDVSEIERLFSAVVLKPDKGADRRKSAGSKSDKVTLVDLRRANNTEIMLSKVKMPLPDIMTAVIALDESVLDIDQVENLIKFCPTKEEMDLLKAYSGDKEKLGKCEQYFLELMKVPRVESKLRVFSFKIQFGTQIKDFKKSLITVNSACEEVRKSLKLKEVMKKVLFLGNTLNNGTARGSAVGFKLDSLLKLYDTRSSNSKMTLMHYLCKVLASKSPTLIDFHQDLSSLEAASKIQLKSLAEEMQSISKGLEKVKVELAASENDGPVSDTFRKTLNEFVGSSGTEVASVTELYSVVGRNADGLALYFGEDPARYPFEQVCATLINFVRLFQKAHEENLKEAEQEKKKLEKEAQEEKAKEKNLSKSDRK